MKKVSIGLIRESKNPPDRRVALTPEQCIRLKQSHPDLEIKIQPSDLRCYTDAEYAAAGLDLSEDMESCELLLGVKEVKEELLIPGKTYLFFSHTAKKQPYNRSLLQAVVEKNVRLVDYEYLTDTDGVRVVAFGRWAGVVGAYNGLRGAGLRSGKFTLPPAHSLKDLEEMKGLLEGLDLGITRMVVTGGGRVAGGALEILKAAGILEVGPEAYLSGTFDRAVFTRLDPWHYTRSKDAKVFDFRHFVERPDLYQNAFLSYARRTDMFIAAHFWDPKSPNMLTRADLKGGSIPIRIVADISCDLDGPIASTIRPSTIADPFYGYDPVSGKESEAFQQESITVMAVDNLPGELPRDASRDFGEALLSHVIPELLNQWDTGMLERACIAEKGRLAKKYDYLQYFLEGKE